MRKSTGWQAPACAIAVVGLQVVHARRGDRVSDGNEDDRSYEKGRLADGFGRVDGDFVVDARHELYIELAGRIVEGRAAWQVQGWVS